ncbi:hypothetical protein NQ315_003912 [Exocentrus adspersus]|uniref:Uncharacterized protein n=1 Tax=Exocentrus adspersus TaxID=1586481 RepID=A0AAV8VYD6_9CUCU|nr:hypothetical protein NQ315_003912 [Exocentrus adspersus]
MKLLVILTACAVCLDLTRAKSTSSVNQEVKVKGSSKLNSLTTTSKPDTQFSPLEQQQYRQQSYPQQPPPPHYQLRSQPLRQLQGLNQPIVLRPIQAAGQPQAPQGHLQQQQPQLQQLTYQAQLQAQPQLQHIIQRAFFVPQQQNRPAHMILIAQPAYVPANVVYGSGTQQLLNYFHSNPQARFQLLHGGAPQAQAQPQHQILQPTPAHSIGNYQLVGVPAHYQPNLVAVPAPIPQHVPYTAPNPVVAPVPALRPVPVPVVHQESTHQPSPLQLAQIAHIAAQQYSRINPSQLQHQQVLPSHPVNYQSEPRASQEGVQAAGPVRSIPPIITGFENFSPEQQEKIKAQLSEYFGGPLRPLANTRTPTNSAEEVENQGKSQYAQKYREDESRYSSNEFVPSEQIKGDASTSSSNVFKTHYSRM